MSITEGMVGSHLLLTAAWVTWCVLHSFLITPWWIRLMKRMLGARFAFYRLAYTIVSILTLAPVLWFQWRIETVTWWSWNMPWVIVQWAGLLVAAAIFLFAARQYDQKFFFGIRQIRDHLHDRTPEFSGFRTSGILNHVRHPYYTAGIILLLFWGDVSAANVILKGVGIAYFIVGAFLEERKLVREFGDAYRRYQQRVPMLVPRLTAGNDRPSA